MAHGTSQHNSQRDAVSRRAACCALGLAQAYLGTSVGSHPLCIPLLTCELPCALGFASLGGGQLIPEEATACIGFERL